MTFVFVDTVGLLALWDENDQWHGAADAAWRKVLASGAVPYTTPFVLAECSNAASRRPYRPHVELIRQQFEQAKRMIWPTDDEWSKVWQAYFMGKPGDPGIVDHLSFAVMRRIGITNVFTNDRHFKAAGFNTLFEDYSMALSPAFPTDPHAILDPAVRWYPGEEQLTDDGYATLIAPLVHQIRRGVKAWRDAGYAGASDTTRALLNHWFKTEHLMPEADGTMAAFAYYFAQREAVESAIWLYEIEQSRDPYALIKYDSSGRLSKGKFQEDWTRYVMKMATGTGKTKVMSLLIAWAYFHKRYEAGSKLSTNFLLIAPNLIVLERLKADFDGLKIFHADPVLPDNGYEGQNWRDEFQVTLHVQDQIGVVSDTGNLFLTNIQRVYDDAHVPGPDDDDTTDYFLGQRPAGKTNESRVDVGQIVRDVPDLIVLNDEAHHIHDDSLAWFKNIRDISDQLRLKGSELSAKFDLTATPKHTNGAIFVQTISDYPLVEAIRQNVVKTPVLPDAASRAKLQEHKSAKFIEQYADYLNLGYLEWKKVYDELRLVDKKSVLFVMTDDTRNCDEVGEYLKAHYPELRGAVLVIHTKRNGEISEASSGKSHDDLEKLRKQSREIDQPENPYKAIVSVMMLREGWDVKNVVALVGLRPYKATSKILPEQTLGRGLRRMFRGKRVQEKVSVIGTQAFVDFVEGIKSEGVELEYAEMGERSPAQSPVIVEVDRGNPKKDIDKLDIELPVLAPQYRDYKNLEQLDVAALAKPGLAVRQFSDEEQREIVFKDIDTDAVSHKTVMEKVVVATHQAVVGYFAMKIMRDLRLVGGYDVLFGKLKQFMAESLFAQPVDLDDLNVLRNLSEVEPTRAILETFKIAINALTVQDRGTTQTKDQIKLSNTRPAVVNQQSYFIPKKSIFNKIVGDNDLERDVAAFLDGCEIISFVKNTMNMAFRIEYRAADGMIHNYYPDFVVKQTERDIWIIETKGREDLDDPHKWERLKQWCADATAQDSSVSFRPLFVREQDWETYRPTTFEAFVAAFAENPD